MKKSKGLGLSDRKENENKKTRTGIAFRLVAKCLHCGLSSFGADQSNCPPLLECQPAMGDMDGSPGIGQIGIDPGQQVQVVSITTHRDVTQ